jgi:hypothetical protein
MAIPDLERLASRGKRARKTWRKSQKPKDTRHPVHGDEPERAGEDLSFEISFTNHKPEF